MGLKLMFAMSTGSGTAIAMYSEDEEMLQVDYVVGKPDISQDLGRNAEAALIEHLLEQAGSKTVRIASRVEVNGMQEDKEYQQWYRTKGFETEDEMLVGIRRMMKYTGVVTEEEASKESVGRNVEDYQKYTC